MRLGMHLQAPSRDFGRLKSFGKRKWFVLDGGMGELRELWLAGLVEEATLRFYETGIMERWSPKDWVDRCVKELLAVRFDADGRVWHWYEVIKFVVFACELNLDIEHTAPHWSGSWKSVAAYADIADWMIRVNQRWRWHQTVPYPPDGHEDLLAVGLDAPALSPGNNPPGTEPESEYDLLAAAGAYDGYDRIEIHVYGDPRNEWEGGRYIRICAKLESLRLTQPRPITEYNWMLVVDGRQQLPDDVVDLTADMLAEITLTPSLRMPSVHYFLWSSAKPGEHPELEDKPRELVDQLLQLDIPLTPLPTPPEGGDPMEEWLAAFKKSAFNPDHLSPEDLLFRLHDLAIGNGEAAKKDLNAALGLLGAYAAEAKLIADRLPNL